MKKNKDGFKPCPFCGEFPKTEKWLFSEVREGLAWSHFCDMNGPLLTVGVTVYGKDREEIKARWNGKMRRLTKVGKNASL